MSIRHLRVKIKSLAEEARIIRHEERQTRGREKWNLQYHRKTVVRPEARASLLAYCLLRGRTYETIEQSPHTNPDWSKVSRMVAKYGSCSTDAADRRVKEWADAKTLLAA